MKFIFFLKLICETKLQLYFVMLSNSNQTNLAREETYFFFFYIFLFVLFYFILFFFESEMPRCYVVVLIVASADANAAYLQHSR